MKKKHISFFLITLLLGLFNCQKQTPTFQISGSVSDQSLNSVLSDVNITFYKIKAGSSTPTKIASTQTNSDGTYTIEFDRDLSESYYAIAEKENYFDSEQSILFEDLKVGEENTINFNIYAKSWVKIQLKNLTPEPDDYITISKQEGKKNCLDCCDFFEYTVTNTDTTFYCINNGNSSFSILYSSFGDNLFNTAIESVTSTSFDTTDLYISY